MGSTQQWGLRRSAVKQIEVSEIIAIDLRLIAIDLPLQNIRQLYLQFEETACLGKLRIQV